MPVIGLECATLTAAVDTDLGCGLLGLWRTIEQRRHPVMPPAPFPHTRPAELVAAWPSSPDDRNVPVRVVHRTPLSISWAWPDGATGRWELRPESLVASWQGLAHVALADRLPDGIHADATDTSFALHVPHSSPRTG